MLNKEKFRYFNLQLQISFNFKQNIVFLHSYCRIEQNHSFSGLADLQIP